MRRQDFNEKEIAAIIERLTQRGLNAKCPMCTSGQEMNISTQAFSHALLVRDGGNRYRVANPPKFTPSALLWCDHCGFIQTHSLYVLGLMSDDGQFTMDKE